MWRLFSLQSWGELWGRQSNFMKLMPSLDPHLHLLLSKPVATTTSREPRKAGQQPAWAVHLHGSPLRRFTSCMWLSHRQEHTPVLKPVLASTPQLWLRANHGCSTLDPDPSLSCHQLLLPPWPLAMAATHSSQLSEFVPSPYQNFPPVSLMSAMTLCPGSSLSPLTHCCPVLYLLPSHPYLPPSNIQPSLATSSHLFAGALVIRQVRGKFTQPPFWNTRVPVETFPKIRNKLKFDLANPIMSFPGGPVVKKKTRLPMQEMQEMPVQSLGREDPLE